MLYKTLLWTSLAAPLVWGQTAVIYDPLNSHLTVSLKPTTAGNHLTAPCTAGKSPMLFDSGSYYLCTTSGNPGTWTLVGTGSAASFGTLTGGTNAVPSAMLVGNGSTLGYTGTGTINATTLAGSGVGTSGAVFGLLSTNNTHSGTQTFNNVTITGTCTGCGAGGASFGSLASGTNTTAAMIVGSGATLTATGTGVLSANQVNGAAVPATTTVLMSNGSSQLVQANTVGTGSVALNQYTTLLNPTLGVPASAITQRYTNDATTGTIGNRAVKFNGINTVVVTSTSDTEAIGIVAYYEGVSGNPEVAIGGTVYCQFDNATIAGHYVQLSTTVTGECHDAGASPPTSGSVILGKVTTTGGAGNQMVTVNVVPLGGGTGSQTPWLSDINGNSHSLNTVARIGIGTGSPLVPLDTGTVTQPIKIATYADATPNAYGMGLASGQLTFGAGINPTSGVPQMVLSASGQLGINTANPLTYIDTGNTTGGTVKIATYADAVNLSYGIGIGTGMLTFGAGVNPATGTPQMVLTSTGRVGIVNTAPAYPLDITGDVNITGVYRIGGVPISGGGGGLSYQGTATANAFVTAYDSTHVQTPSATSTLDTSGNAVFSTVTTGTGCSGCAGSVSLTAGVDQAIVANSAGFGAPTSIPTAYRVMLPGAGPTGANQFLLQGALSGSETVGVWTTFSSTNLTDTGNIIRTSNFSGTAGDVVTFGAGVPADSGFLATNVVRKDAANTGTAAMSLDMSASTVSNAFRVQVAAGALANTNGAIAYDSTANMLHAAQNAADAKVALFTVTPANNDCVKWNVSGTTYKLDTAGAACGSGGGSGVVGTPYDATAQTASITSQTLYTNGGTAGRYRVYWYMNQNALCTTNTGQPLSVIATFNWTDSGAARTEVVGPLTLSTAQSSNHGTTSVSDRIPVYLAASAAVTMTTTHNGGTCTTGGPASYDIHAAVLQQ